MYAEDVDHEILTEFINSNCIIDLDINKLNKQLLLNETAYKSIRSLKIDCSNKTIDLTKFNSI